MEVGEEGGREIICTYNYNVNTRMIKREGRRLYVPTTTVSTPE